jgi:Rrf2 family protein
MAIPGEFLAKILKTLVKAKLVRSTRGAHGGYNLGRPASSISFLDVIEAVEGPVGVNLCSDQDKNLGCSLSASCTMHHVWREGQSRMLEVYRSTTLDKLAMRSLGAGHESPVLTAMRGA